MIPGVPQYPALARVLSARADVRLAVLFGSNANGQTHAESDVDIAILPAGDPPLAWELSLQGDSEAACGRTVDLVRLDQANDLVRWHVARDGILVCEASPGLFRLFRANAAIEHDEFGPRFALAAETYRRAIIAGRGAGTP